MTACAGFDTVRAALLIFLLDVTTKLYYIFYKNSIAFCGYAQISAELESLFGAWRFDICRTDYGKGLFMAVRRKSNWYIYLLAFVVTTVFVIMVIFTFRWYLFPERTREVGLNNAGGLSESFTPTAEHNFNALIMLSKSADDSPELYVIAAYNAVESRLSFIPLPTGISVAAEGRDLPNIYAAQGGAGIISAIEDIVGVKLDNYVTFTRESFVDFLAVYGNVRYNVPKTIIVADGIEADTFNTGSQLFSPESCYRYIMLADFEEGESYRFNIIGDVLSSLVNQNYSYADSTLLDSYSRHFIDAQDSSITEEDYTAHKAALLNTIIYGSSPAEYYVPYGDYEDGGFKISDNSIITIKQKTGQD